MYNWQDPSYLQIGTPRQQQAFWAWQALGLGAVLGAYHPVITGTIPLDIDVAGSDLDVCCEVAPAAQATFAAQLRQHYGHLLAFQLKHFTSRGYSAIVGSFSYEGLPIELFGQALPATQQYAYQHLVVEAAVLAVGGEPWRAAVRHLKQQGLKTEPAFAQLLRLPGDPYEALLTLEGLPVSELRALVARYPLPGNGPL